ncbi:MAG: hypothetical protein GY746_16970 [Gammaproteobacteria bacterium]|nr:hypothetical protein [Gammaproteobacteria bacterium]
MRSHRAFVRLSDQLAVKGFHVLRFDYFSTGDSAGDDGEACLDDWLGDIQKAILELRDISGVTKVSIIGARLGATLATTAVSSLSNIDSLILWDPVISGKNYIRDITSLNARFTQNPYHFKRTPAQPINELNPEELLGFRFPEQLRKSLSDLDINRVSVLNIRRMALIFSKKQPDHISLLKNLSKLGVKTQIYSSQEQVDWDKSQEINLGLTLHKVTEQMIQLLTTEDNA